MDSHARADPFARSLTIASEALLDHVADPWRAVEAFEPILEQLNAELVGSEARLEQARSVGRQLFARLKSDGSPVAMEVRHFCWHLQYLGDVAKSPTSSVLDLLLATLTRFAHYERHESGRCAICAEFPGDLPVQPRTGGIEHFREWFRRKSDSSPKRTEPETRLSDAESEVARGGEAVDL